MAKIFRRDWTSRGPMGRPVRHVAFGYTFMVHGRRERKVSSAWTTQAEALEALTVRLRQVEAGQLEPSRQDVTFEAAVVRYLSLKEQEGKRSMRDDRRILQTRLVPFFGAGLPLRHLTKEKITAYKEHRLGQPKRHDSDGRPVPLSAYTVCNELSVLRHLLQLATEEWGYLDHVPRIRLPKKPEGRQRFLDGQEIERLLAACDRSRNPYLGCIVRLAIGTGMRKSEILGLRWEQIDLEADAGFSAKIRLYRTKNGEPRGVALSSAVHGALAALEPDPAQRQGLLFRKRDDRAWGQIRRAFASAMDNAGIAGFRFHDLRHTAASHLVMSGRSMKDVAEILGHKDLKMTNRYAHLSPLHLRSAVEALAHLIPPPVDRLAHKMAQSGVDHEKPNVSLDAPVAQSDRAAVS